MRGERIAHWGGRASSCAVMRTARTRALDREILRLAVPALGSLVAEPLYVLADTAIVGRVLGTEALAGLALASSILLTVYALAIFLAYGTTSSVARLHGAGRERDAAAEGVQALWLALGCGVAAAVVLAVTGDALLRGLGATGAVAEAAGTYLRLSLPGLPFLLLVLAATGWLRGREDTVTPLVVAGVSAVLNLVVELGLVLGLGTGIGGSALSTVLAQVVAGCWSAALVLRAVRRLEVGVRPDPVVLRRLTRVARDLVVRTGALRLALVAVTAVAARISVVAVAAHEVAFAVWSTLALALDAVAIAGQAITGRELGAGRVEGAVAAGRRMLAWGLWTGVAAGLGVAALQPVLTTAFSTDPSVRTTVAALLVCVAVLQPANGVVFVLDGLLIGAGDLAFLARAMVGASLVLIAGAALVLLSGAGVVWLWVALGGWVLSRLAPLLLRFRSGAWAVPGATR